MPLDCCRWLAPIHRDAIKTALAGAVRSVRCSDPVAYNLALRDANYQCLILFDCISKAWSAPANTCTRFARIAIKRGFELIDLGAFPYSRGPIACLKLFRIDMRSCIVESYTLSAVLAHHLSV